MTSAWQVRPSSPKDWRLPDGFDNLNLVHNIPKPVPGAKTALVRMHATALNARDKFVVSRDPIYPIKHTANLTPCADGAGIVEAVGAGSEWSVDDRVFVSPINWVEGDVPTLESSKSMGAGDVDGTLREYAVFEDSRLIRMPAHLSLDEAAALGVAAGTAMNALFYGPLPLQKGMHVLTQGTGGVSAFAIQLASAAGATVIATSSSNAKLEDAKRLGAHHLINYRNIPDWADEVLRLTDGKGADHVLDVAGAGTIEQSVKACRRGGLVSLMGFLSKDQPHNVAYQIIFKALSLRGIFGFRRDMLEAVAKMVEEHEIHPLVGEVREFEDAKAAFESLRDWSAVGKIVIRGPKAGR